MSRPTQRRHASRDGNSEPAPLADRPTSSRPSQQGHRSISDRVPTPRGGRASGGAQGSPFHYQARRALPKGPRPRCCVAATEKERSPVRHECRSVNRNCCLGIWNLYFVFQFPNRRARRVIWILHGDIWILKSVQVPKSAARRGIWILDGLSRFLETVQFSKIRGEAWNLESG